MTVLLLRRLQIVQAQRAFSEEPRRGSNVGARIEPAVRTQRGRGHRRAIAATVILSALAAVSPLGRVERSSITFRSEVRGDPSFAAATGTVAALATNAVDAPSLFSLADGKRLSGDLDQAKRAYVALRSRFQNSVEAGDATFWIGEIEFRHERDYVDAALWFETYLRERPRGALAVRAQARLMEALYRIADWGDAVRIANEYLAAHPDAPDSKLALAILNDEGLP